MLSNKKKYDKPTQNISCGLDITFFRGTGFQLNYSARSIFKLYDNCAKRTGNIMLHSENSHEGKGTESIKYGKSQPADGKIQRQKLLLRASPCEVLLYPIIRAVKESKLILHIVT